VLLVVHKNMAFLSMHRQINGLFQLNNNFSKNTLLLAILPKFISIVKRYILEKNYKYFIIFQKGDI